MLMGALLHCNKSLYMTLMKSNIQQLNVFYGRNVQVFLKDEIVKLQNYLDKTYYKNNQPFILMPQFIFNIRLPFKTVTLSFILASHLKH